MKIRKLSAVIALCIAGTASVHAAVITWGSATTISGDTDVSTQGTLQYAYSGSQWLQTVNGVPFAIGRITEGFGGNITPSAGWIDGSYWGANPTGITGDYLNLMIAGGPYNGSSLTLNNLTVGQQYAVQLWANDSRTAGIGRTTIYSDGNGNSVTLDQNTTDAVGGPGQFVIGTFTADATGTQLINVAGGAGTGISMFNAIQVRAIPEPATLGMVAAFGGAILFIRRRFML